jgi:hypothetical protein
MILRFSEHESVKRATASLIGLDFPRYVEPVNRGLFAELTGNARAYAFGSNRLTRP